MLPHAHESLELQMFARGPEAASDKSFRRARLQRTVESAVVAVSLSAVR